MLRCRYYDENGILADETPHPRTELGCRRHIIDDVTRVTLLCVDFEGLSIPTSRVTTDRRFSIDFLS